MTERLSQLFISYLELLDTREKRQAQLKKVYNFDCVCQRCRAELAKVGERQAMAAATWVISLPPACPSFLDALSSLSNSLLRFT